MIISPSARLRAAQPADQQQGRHCDPGPICAVSLAKRFGTAPRAAAPGNPALSAASADCAWRGGPWHQGKMARRGDELVIVQYGPGAE